MIYIEKDTNHMAEKGATLFAMDAEKNVKERGRFLVALSGGGTPRPLFRKLKHDPFRSTIPWSKIHIFWVDERCVPPKDEASNYGSALKDFIEVVPIPKSQLHPMPGHIAGHEGAALYEEKQRAESDKDQADDSEVTGDKVAIEVVSDGTDGPVVEKIKRKTTPVEETQETE